MKKLSRALSLSLLVSLALTGAVPSKAKTLVLTDENNLAMTGYDPVSYFDGDEPVKGDAKYHAKHEGAGYRFASKQNRDKFKADPQKYAPQFGGYCAMAMAMGMLEEADPTQFLVHGGEHLLLQRNAKAHGMFMKDSDGNYAKAKANWPRVVAEQGK